jgi:hypothetical protein
VAALMEGRLLKSASLDKLIGSGEEIIETFPACCQSREIKSWKLFPGECGIGFSFQGLSSVQEEKEMNNYRITGTPKH